jgi:hypothetical protein
MEDRVLYAVPFGWLGRLVHRWIVAPMLGRIFAFRRQAIGLRFGIADAADVGQVVPMRAAAPA